MVKLCFPLLLRFLATPLRHPMNNKYHFRNISLVIWVQNSGKIVDKNIPPVKIFYFAHCLRVRDVKTFSFLESQILVPRRPASYLCPGGRIFSRRPCSQQFILLGFAHAHPTTEFCVSFTLDIAIQSSSK